MRKHFQPGKGPSIGLLLDCEILANICFEAFAHTHTHTQGRPPDCLVRLLGNAEDVHGRVRLVLHVTRDS